MRISDWSSDVCSSDLLGRHQAAMQSRAKRLSELTGIDHMQAEVHGNLSIAEIAKANQIGTELEQRARDQGLYVPIQDVQRDVGQIFSLMSEFYSTAANRLDPHGDRKSTSLNSSH